MPRSPNAIRPPLHFDTIADSEASRYTLRARMEINGVLRAMQRHRSPLGIYMGADPDPVTSHVVGVMDAYVFLDHGPDAARNWAAARAQYLVFIGNHFGVRVHFSAEAMVNTLQDGHPAFRIAMPQSLIRLQRREYARMVTSHAYPLKCLIQRNCTDPKDTLEVSLLDLSSGGFGAIGLQDASELECGRVYPSCRLMLPGIGQIEPAIRITHSFDMMLTSGRRARRAGCMFVDLGRREETLIQRYLLELERGGSVVSRRT